VRPNGRVVEVVATWPGRVPRSCEKVVVVVVRRPGPCALEQKGGGGGGDVAWSRRTLHARMRRWEGGGGGDEASASLRVHVER
jgi:hypothetical protein